MFNLRFLFILLLLSNSPMVLCAFETDSNTVFYVFTNDGCQPCVDRYNQVRSLFSEVEFVKYDVSDKINLNLFTDVVNTLDDVLLSLPIYGIFYGTSLKIIVAGEVSTESWETIIKEENVGVPVYIGGVNGLAEKKTIIMEDEVIAKLVSLFTGTSISGLTKGFWSLLVPVSVAAIMDAVNPCAVSVFLVMLTLILYSFKRNVVLSTGLAFSLAVFVTYLLFGLGVLRVISNISWLRYLTAAFAFILGVLSIYEFFSGERKHIPNTFANQITKYIEKVSNPRSGFIAGVVTGALLLPCSSAPYFVALNLLSENATQFEGFLLIVLYNFIIVSPFLAITICIHVFSVQTVDMRLWLQEKRRWINLIIGLGLILMSFYSIYG